ncbi:MAG: IS21-like element helper ATPase IstB [Rhodomicrobium sp.]
MSEAGILHSRAKALNLHGLLANWDEAFAAGWAQRLLGWEEEERARRSLERRIRAAHIGRFKPLCDFDWNWPKSSDRAGIEGLMQLDFLKDATNVVLTGPNGTGKSTLAQNIAHQAVIQGYTVMFVSAGQMLGDLSALDSDSALRRRLRHYAAPQLLAVDEVGYLSYSNRHADLLFELISRRYEQKSTIVTTNRPFAEWREVFPTAACVASLIDRLVHHAEVFAIDGESYRLKEANERAQNKGRQRRGAKA